jgi:hypothetical protein
LGRQGPEVQRHAVPPEPPPGLYAHETHAATSLLGQFRTSVSSWLWLRTDLYLHNGVAMRPLTDAERRAGDRAATHAHAEDEKLHDDSNFTTVVPSAEHDFRGVFGDVERATQAWKDMRGHSHNDPRVALPLYRLMTWVDPHFIPGWTVGAHVLTRDGTERANRLALELLAQGKAANPQSIAIRKEIAYVWARKIGDWERALPYFEEARAIGRAHPRIGDETELEALRDVYRWLALWYRDAGRHGDQTAAAREGLARFAGDPVLTRLSMPEARGEIDLPGLMGHGHEEGHACPCPKHGE